MKNHKNIKISPIGDKAVRVQLGTEISPDVNQKIRSFSLLLEQVKINGVIEWIPTYTAITIIYNPSIITYHRLVEKIEAISCNQKELTLPPPELIYIPTYYGDQLGPDIETVAEHNQLSVEEVINIHTEGKYLIYMMGFTPGFPYLGGMSKKIATPRLETPRQQVSPGSVGIAGEQTGIYSIETPGGWQIIGRTPLRLYDANRKSPMLLQAGNYLKFVSITKKEFDNIEADIQRGTYRLQKKKITN